MSASAQTAPPSIDLFFETVHAFHRTAVLKAALELNLFTAIDEGAATVNALAAKCASSTRGIRILCDYLTVMGWLTKSGDSYQLSGEAATFASRKSPAYVGGAIEFLLSPTQMEAFAHLTEAVRKGGTAATKEGVVAPDHPVWVGFAKAMMPLMAFPAELFAELLSTGPPAKKILDIAAGHGIFGIAVARRSPEAEVTALDWENVLTVAQESAHSAGVANRYSKLVGSAFDVPYGSDYDLILLTNFLHHFDLETCEQLLKKVYAALKAGGRAAILDFVPNEDRISPAVPAQFSLMMLATTPSGDAYTYPQYQTILRKAGFSRTELHPLHPTFFSAIVAHK